MKQSANIQKLMDHLTNTVYEGMLKLGGMTDETFSIYYDLDLLNYLLETDFTSNQSCEAFLNSAEDSLQIGGCQIIVSLEKGRFRFQAPRASLTMIYAKGEQHGFLRDIIGLASTHHYTLDDVKEVFEKYSKDYMCEEIDHPEFQYVLYFKDEAINHYKYCFTFDAFGGYYHRLLDYDYQKALAEN